MKRPALALLLCCMFLASTSHVAHCVEITVDASSSLGPVNTRLFGHNTVYMNGINGLWDTGTQAVKTSGLSAMQNAGTGKNAFVRSAGGNHHDTYQGRVVGGLSRARYAVFADWSRLPHRCPHASQM